VSEQFLNGTSAQSMQCHTIKIVQKLDIYNRFKNGSSNEID